MKKKEEKKERREAVIFVRIDNMVTYHTEGQRSIRLSIKSDSQSINESVAEALRNAPPVEEWQGS